MVLYDFAPSLRQVTQLPTPESQLCKFSEMRAMGISPLILSLHERCHLLFRRPRGLLREHRVSE